MDHVMITALRPQVVFLGRRSPPRLGDNTLALAAGLGLSSTLSQTQQNLFDSTSRLYHISLDLLNNVLFCQKELLAMVSAAFFVMERAHGVSFRAAVGWGQLPCGFRFRFNEKLRAAQQSLRFSRATKSPYTHPPLVLSPALFPLTFSISSRAISIDQRP